MQLHFSTAFGFDNVYPRLVTLKGTAQHGKLQLGLKGLLEFLELHLGLFKEDVQDVQRISHYKKAVTSAIGEYPDLYIQESYVTDAWGTAKQLLYWRDELQLALWNFDCSDSSEQRLYTLSKIEAALKGLPEGVNDRWRALLPAIAARKALPLKQLIIHEPQQSIDPYLLVLFKALESKGVSITLQPQQDSTEGNSDLANFKKRLLKPTQGRPASVLNDKSLIILRAENEKLLADALAERLKNDKEINPIFIIPSRGAILEHALVSRGIPAMGYLSTDEQSVLDQLMTLITVFLWQPFDPEKIIQFLTLPLAPIDKNLRHSLAEAYANEPRIGEKKWKATIAQHQTAFPASSTNLEKQLKLWFDRQRYSIAGGAPVKAILELYTDLKKWADSVARFLKEEDEKSKALRRLAQLCQTLISLIELENPDKKLIRDIELFKWIEEIEGNSIAKIHIAQIGSYEQVAHPAVITASSEVVVWWNFLDNGNPLSYSSNWSESEMIILNSAQIYENKRKIKHWYWQLTNGVLQCGKQLILCIPETSEGSPVEPNPLYNDLEASFENLEPLSQEVLVQEGVQILQKQLPLQTYPKKKIPKRAAAWNIRTDIQQSPREHESFSSLSKLFYYPYAYFLYYHLKIKPIEIPEVTISSRLQGNLAHHTAEEVWKDSNLLSYDDDRIIEIVTVIVDQILVAEGAVLLMPRNATTLKEYKDTTIKALTSLVRMIRDNGWSVFSAEHTYHTPGILPLLGHVDLVLQRGKELAIVDLKWGGLSTKRQELIKEQELQLIIYDQLLQARDRRIYLHYYIISDQKMLSRNTIAFKEASVIPSTEEESTHRKTLWEKMLRTYELRGKQLEVGELEVGDGMYVQSINGPEELYEKNEHYLQVPIKSDKKMEDKYSNYKNLIGLL